MTTDPTFAPAPTFVPRPAPTTDSTSITLALVTAILLVVAVVINVVFGLRFPSNAPIELAWNFGISLSMAACAIALVVRFAVIRRRPRVAATPADGTSGLAVAGLILGVVALVGWLAVGGAEFLVKLVSGERLRYYLDTSGAFFFGIPWMLALFFGVASYRPGRARLTTVFSWVAIGIAAFVLVASLVSAVIYGLGLSD